MNDVILTYRPYRWETIAASFFVVMEIGYLILISIAAPIDTSPYSIYFWIPIILVIVMLFGIKRCYDRSKITVYFTQEGMHLINDGKTAWRFVPWENFTYLYHQDDTKRIHLVLSSEELDKKQLKKMVYLNDLGSKITVNNAVIITLDLLQDKATARVLEIVKEKVVAKNI
ncbi:MAG: hypothetical protein E7616_07200 [Ruminococcaceae bacterium]|nr:hypothetical protein [Oscillospiraceae bacterium]